MSEPNAPADKAQTTAAERRFGVLALALALGYVAAVFAQQGDFWPFSRFAMFSNPRKPWRRALVRELDAAAFAQPLAEVSEKELPGKPYAIDPVGIDQHDLSAAIRRIEGPLTPEQSKLIAGYFARAQAPHLVLYVARGTLRSKEKTVSVRYRPIARIAPDGVHSALSPTPGTP